MLLISKERAPISDVAINKKDLSERHICSKFIGLADSTIATSRRSCGGSDWVRARGADPIDAPLGSTALSGVVCTGSALLR